MAKRGREGIAKRARERARQQKQAAKRERRQGAALADTAADVDAPDEAALMEEFRILSERRAAGNVSEDDYSDERQRIFEQLGIDSD